MIATAKYSKKNWKNQENRSPVLVTEQPHFTAGIGTERGGKEGGRREGERGKREEGEGKGRREGVRGWDSLPASNR